jgi:hypothetical protein
MIAPVGPRLPGRAPGVQCRSAGRPAGAAGPTGPGRGADEGAGAGVVARFAGEALRARGRHSASIATLYAQAARTLATWLMSFKCALTHCFCYRKGVVASSECYPAVELAHMRLGIFILKNICIAITSYYCLFG